MWDKWNALLAVVAVVGVVSLLLSVFFDNSILASGWVLSGLGGSGLVIRSASQKEAAQTQNE